MFRFAHPEYLYALYGLPILVGLYFILLKRQKQLLNKFANTTLHKVLVPKFSRVKSWIKMFLVITSLALLVLAAANPQVGTRLEEVKQSGIDVFILLDVSLSMSAEDIKPNRLEKAKFQISSLIQKLRGDRIGLIIFSGDAYVQIPLTTDYSAANLFLSAVDFKSVPQPGTAIAAAINLANKSFDYNAGTQKVIVVITDGEDHEGDLEEAISEATDKKLKIYTIGLGSPDGVPIPVYNSQNQTIGFKKDNEGNTVLTKLNESILIDIAKKGNGKYYRGNNYEDYLDQIFNELSSIEKTEFGTKKVTDYEDRFYYFLVPAIFLLILEFFLSESKSKWFSKLNRKFGLEK
ncbi:MAG: VWA domain-containing protein [Ignavibacteriaceae bacterium]|nr:VWA domain-containing protein [Ignavibacteriaceae bacterium]